MFLKREAAGSAEMLIALLQKIIFSRENLQITTDQRDLASVNKPLCCIFMKFFGVGRRSRVSIVKIDAVTVILHAWDNTKS